MLTSILLGIVLIFGCSEKEEGPSERFLLLTTPTWEPDSLLVNKQDASGPGQMLESFNGDVKFNTDGTGTFGTYSGTWTFQQNETQLVILSSSVGFPITTMIDKLTSDSLKIYTSFPNNLNPEEPFNIRMTFKSK